MSLEEVYQRELEQVLFNRNRLYDKLYDGNRNYVGLRLFLSDFVQHNIKMFISENLSYTYLSNVDDEYVTQVINDLIISNCLDGSFDETTLKKVLLNNVDNFNLWLQLLIQEDEKLKEVKMVIGIKEVEYYTIDDVRRILDNQNPNPKPTLP